MQGKIIKGIAGFYYVYTEQAGILECKAKGIFRKDHIKPLVGDNVEVELLSEEEKTGNVTTILSRQNALIRPAVANIDQALVIFAATHPEPNLNLLDRFLVMMERQAIPVIICFNKEDLLEASDLSKLCDVYKDSGCHILTVSAKNKSGLTKLENLIAGKTTTVAGPSGVGKSSLINVLCDRDLMETGEISRKIERGKHTTRHSELIPIDKDTFIMDTPGFSSLGLFDMEKEELKACYPEFIRYEDSCRFRGCVHVGEPDCGVKNAVGTGNISKERYENYLLLYEELKNRKKY